MGARGLGRAEIRVLVAEDEPLVRAGLTSVLESQPDMTVVGEVSDGAQTVEAFRRSAPDVVLIDVGLVTDNGRGGAENGGSVNWAFIPPMLM